jgi:hypothetical protein
VCSPVEQPAKVVRDPVVIFEVLSPSTAAKDWIVKAREYQGAPSIRRYVMLEQDRSGPTVHVRAEDGWSVLMLGNDDMLAMPELGLSIPLAEFYEGLVFERPVEDNDNEQSPSRAPDRLHPCRGCRSSAFCTSDAVGVIQLHASYAMRPARGRRVPDARPAQCSVVIGPANISRRHVA